MQILRVGSSIPPLQSDGGALESDPDGKAALLSNFLMGSSLALLLAVLYPVIAGPSFVLLPFGPVRSDGCSHNLILMMELIC